MTNGGQLGSISSSIVSTAPKAKIKWLERSRWWNPLCSNLLHTAPENNRIGEYNASLAFYELVAGSCTICITPVAVKDLFLRPDQVLGANDVTGVGGAVLYKNIGTVQPKDWTYCWTRPDAVVTFWVRLSDGDLVPSLSYLATLRFRVRKCGQNGMLKTPTDPQENVDLTVRVLRELSVVKTSTVAVDSGWATYSVVLNPTELAALGDLHSLSLDFTTSASGGDPDSAIGVAISWAELAVVLVD